MGLLRGILLKQIHEGTQLEPGDVGPASAALHVLKHFEQAVAIGGKAAAEGTVLKAAMQLLQLAEQGKQCLRPGGQLLGEGLQFGQECAQSLLLRGREPFAEDRLGWRDRLGGFAAGHRGRVPGKRVVESRDIVRGSGN